MIRSTLPRAGALVTSLAAAPLVLAQESLPPPAVVPEHWAFIALMAGLGMLFVIGIVATALFAENRRQRQKLTIVALPALLVFYTERSDR